MTTTQTAQRRAPRMDPALLWILLPILAFFTITIAIPTVIGIVMSFTNSVGYGDFQFIGFTNYIALFSDPAILASYGFTFGFAIVTVIVVNAVGFFLALGLTSKIRLRTPLRTVFVMPMVVSGIVIAFVFNFIFSQSLPGIGEALGIQWLSSNILANKDLAWIAIVIVTAWQAIPGTLLIYIAGLLSVPGEVYEAADLDGASPTAKLLHITLPLVASYVSINMILGVKNFLNAYDIIVGLTDGGPGIATRSIAMTIFKGSNGGDYAYMMANAIIFFILVIAISLVQLRLTRKGEQA